jgi:hypothetical protein
VTLCSLAERTNVSEKLNGRIKSRTAANRKHASLIQGNDPEFLEGIIFVVNLSANTLSMSLPKKEKLNLETY